MPRAASELHLRHRIGLNPTLRAWSEPVLAQAVAESERTGQPQRSVLSLDSRAESGPASPPVVIKVEAHAQGTNRRAVVTNRPGCAVVPPAVYDADAMRGESEHRPKELKLERAADRLSDHRFLANCFRLDLHTAALNLLVRRRPRVGPAPPTSAAVGRPAELPTAARDEPDRQRFFNRRRGRDPRGAGFAWTWRMRLIKVAAAVITHARRVVVRRSGSGPHRDHFRRVSRTVNGPSGPALSG